MEKEIDRIEAMIITGKYEIPKMVFDKVMQEGIQEGRKQLAEEIMKIYRECFDDCSNPELFGAMVEEKLQKEIKVED